MTVSAAIPWIKRRCHWTMHAWLMAVWGPLCLRIICHTYGIFRDACRANPFNGLERLLQLRAYLQWRSGSNFWRMPIPDAKSVWRAKNGRRSGRRRHIPPLTPEKSYEQKNVIASLMRHIISFVSIILHHSQPNFLRMPKLVPSRFAIATVKLHWIK